MKTRLSLLLLIFTMAVCVPQYSSAQRPISRTYTCKQCKGKFTAANFNTAKGMCKKCAAPPATYVCKKCGKKVANPNLLRNGLCASCRKPMPKPKPKPKPDDDNDDDDDDDENQFYFETPDGYYLGGTWHNDYNTNLTTTLSHLHKRISAYTNVRTGCINENGGLFIAATNDYCTDGTTEIVSALNKLHDERRTINDVCITKSGYWCIIYDNYKWTGNVPSGSSKYLEKYENNKEKILSVSFSESGEYAIVTEKNIATSTDFDSKLVRYIMDNTELGDIQFMSITNKSTIIICENGTFLHNIPKNVADKLQERMTWKPAVIRITDNGTYIAFDGKGKYIYLM